MIVRFSLGACSSGSEIFFHYHRESSNSHKDKKIFGRVHPNHLKQIQASGYTIKVMTQDKFMWVLNKTRASSIGGLLPLQSDLMTNSRLWFGPKLLLITPNSTWLVFPQFTSSGGYEHLPWCLKLVWLNGNDMTCKH